MEILDGTSRRGTRNYPEYVAPILNAEFHKDALGMLAGIPVPMRGFSSAPQETREQVVVEFLRTLRGLVDQWIASGKQAEGEEEPWGRNIEASTPAHPRPITDVLVEYREKNPPRVLIGGDGRFDIAMEPLRISAWPSPPPKLEDTLERARDFAIFIFVQLLDSPSRERLFRCDRCGKYFVHGRAPRRYIKQGTYCLRKTCKRSAAKKRMESTRNKRTDEMVTFSSEVWPRWKPDFGPRSKWVADRVISRTRDIAVKLGKKSENPYPRITGRWVTTHQAEIEKKVKEGGKHATR